MKNYIFCRYDHGKNKDLSKCINCSRKMCPSISNILYGVVFKLPIIKQIYNYLSDKRFDKQMKEENEVFDKYGDCENESIKLIFGVKSYDDLCKCGANLYTMNDLDVIYDKNSRTYSVSIESIYHWDDKKGILTYLKNLLSQFTQYMIDNRLDTNYKISFYDMFYSKICIDCVADTIEECYAKFKFMVDGYCNIYKERE